MVLKCHIFSFLLLVFVLEATAASELTGDVASAGGETAAAVDSKPDVIIKLIKRGAAEKLADSSDELPRDKRRSSSMKNRGRKVGKK